MQPTVVILKYTYVGDWRTQQYTDTVRTAEVVAVVYTLPLVFLHVSRYSDVAADLNVTAAARKGHPYELACSISAFIRRSAKIRA